MTIRGGGQGSQRSLQLGAGETPPCSPECGSVSQPHLLFALISSRRSPGSGRELPAVCLRFARAAGC